MRNGVDILRAGAGAVAAPPPRPHGSRAQDSFGSIVRYDKEAYDRMAMGILLTLVCHPGNHRTSSNPAPKVAIKVERLNPCGLGHGALCPSGFSVIPETNLAARSNAKLAHENEDRMDWTHPKAGYWRAEQPIPVGILVAKVVSRRYLKEHGHYEPANDPQGYSARVELEFTDPHFVGRQGDIVSRSDFDNVDQAKAEAERWAVRIARKYARLR